MQPKFLLPALLLAGSALAQGTVMPLPAFGSTFSSASLSRGLWFQAPIPFVITGLRVPDETGNGTQNVEVFITATPPPTWPTMGSGGQVFYSANQPSANIIPTAIQVNPGDYVSVLGTCGTSTMHNSYGAGSFASDVLGAPVVLERFLTQTNLNTSGGNQQYSYEPGFSIGRVEIYATPASGYAQANPYGDGCGGVAQYASYFELFNAGNFDLGGAPGAETVITHINSGVGFVVLPGAPAWFPPVSGDLGLGDDQVSPAQPLGFSINMGGVTVTDLFISSNGCVWLAPSTNTDYTPTVNELLAQDPRIAVLWQDLNPAASGTIHFDSDPANGVAYVTYNGVQEYGVPGSTINAQLAIYSSGNYELRYGNETISSAGTRTPLVGFSPGNGALAPPAADLSVLPIFTAPDLFVPDLALSSDRPVEGTTMNVTIDNIPAGTGLGTLVLSGSQILPGIQPIGGLGSCVQLVGLNDLIYFFPTGSQHVFPFAVPASGFNGFQAYVQAVTFSPGVTPAGIASSNGLEWLVDAN